MKANGKWRRIGQSEMNAKRQAVCTLRYEVVDLKAEGTTCVGSLTLTPAARQLLKEPGRQAYVEERTVYGVMLCNKDEIALIPETPTIGDSSQIRLGNWTSADEPLTVKSEALGTAMELAALLPNIEYIGDIRWDDYDPRQVPTALGYILITIRRIEYGRDA